MPEPEVRLKDPDPPAPASHLRWRRKLAGLWLGLIAGAAIGAGLGAMDFVIVGKMFLLGRLPIASASAEALLGAILGATGGAVLGLILGVSRSQGGLGPLLGLTFGVIPGALALGQNRWDWLTLLLLADGIVSGLLIGLLVEQVLSPLLPTEDHRHPPGD